MGTAYLRYKKTALQLSKAAAISPQCITKLHPDAEYHVAVLRGAPQLLCAERHLRQKYCTNRDIKYWSTYFLLKSITGSGVIQDWRQQRCFILSYVQMAESTFYRQLATLQELKLLTVDDNYNIHLASYKDAAAIMGLYYEGLIHIPYNPLKHAAKQIFQYFLRAEDIRHNQHRQLDALIYYLYNNPPLRYTITLALVKMGAVEARLLKDKHYLQERLLALQKAVFRHGSDILETVFSLRADVNRGVRCIQRQHDYKSKSSVSYMKRKLFNLKLCSVKKESVESKCKVRIYVPDEASPGKQRDGYKWLRKKLATLWVLTDQINVSYELSTVGKRFAVKKKAA